MKISAVSKMIMSAVLTVCIGAAAVGCGQSSDVAETESAVSIEQSIDESTALSSIEPSGEINEAESKADEASGKTDKTESKADAVSSKTDKTESKANAASSKTDKTVSKPDAASSRTETPESKAAETATQVYEQASEIYEPASQAEESSEQSAIRERDNNGNIVVMLDPGHDDDVNCSARNHPALGVNEQDLNLKIALACYERLSEYEGITPYLTRYDGNCPNADKMFSGDYDCIHKRAYLAEEKNADFFVSLHCNGSTSPGTLGAEPNGITVYVTNYSKFRSECERLGSLILDHVTSVVGFNSVGVVPSALDESKGYYDDGSIKDKYYLMSYNIDNGRPVIIIEHGFMDNINDNAILRDDENLRLIGQADADAIAEYYGLELK